MDTPDHATGFSFREIAEVTKTWEFVKLDLSANGLDIFIDFFATFPEHQQLFPSFKRTPLDVLRHSARLREHTDSVMLAVTSVVESLSRPAALRPVLVKVGLRHQRSRVPERAFVDFKNAFLHWLRHKLGPLLTPSTMKVWEKTMSLIIAGIVAGLEPPPQQRPPPVKAVHFDPNLG